MINRKEFLSTLSLGSLPLVLSSPIGKRTLSNTIDNDVVELVSDSQILSADDYLEMYAEIGSIQNDVYGNGGSVKELEEAFKNLTGKEAAIFLPTGTLANQLAIKLLSGSKTKVFVQENSHVFRDEADAAQSVHNKRLIPVESGEEGLKLEELTERIDYLNRGEVFKSGQGVVSIESPVRRSDGQFVPLSELQRISEYCRKNDLKLHLDGARIQWAEAYEGHSIKEYAALFDTVYISLYKCLGSPGGAVLSGPKELIDQIPHLIKIYGSTIYHNWMFTAPALHVLKTINADLVKVRSEGEKLIEGLRASGQFGIDRVKNGTNIFHLTPQTSDPRGFHTRLREQEKIALRPPNQRGSIAVGLNPTLLNRPVDKLIASFKKAMS